MAKKNNKTYVMNEAKHPKRGQVSSSPAGRSVIQKIVIYNKTLNKTRQHSSCHLPAEVFNKENNKNKSHVKISIHLPAGGV